MARTQLLSRQAPCHPSSSTSMSPTLIAHPPHGQEAYHEYQTHPTTTRSLQYDGWRCGRISSDPFGPRPPLAIPYPQSCPSATRAFCTDTRHLLAREHVPAVSMTTVWGRESAADRRDRYNEGEKPGAGVSTKLTGAKKVLIRLASTADAVISTGLEACGTNYGVSSNYQGGQHPTTSNPAPGVKGQPQQTPRSTTLVFTGSQPLRSSRPQRKTPASRNDPPTNPSFVE
ncbi:hypothetical protein C0Q70_17160 [Pomacea canaliculata]|uniref:Uncharacterized protein n=1 Tax=Pomacea canaliculata TaxID=400727 RepID=A0A2T7NRT3_POMCA|nr:hypothetical protein C0Q70_17160 [Pomacea canaliculata]